MDIQMGPFKCGFWGKAVTIPKSSRSTFRNDAGHDSGMKPVTDSDFKLVAWATGRNLDRDHFGTISSSHADKFLRVTLRT